MGDDGDMLDLMRASRCRHINIGMESVDPASLKSVNKKQNHVDKYKEQFAAIRKRGIEFSLNVMFGLDGDTRATFASMIGSSFFGIRLLLTCLTELQHARVNHIIRTRFVCTGSRLSWIGIHHLGYCV